MTRRDLLEIALSNLTRLRLRTFLTVSGVVIAVGAFVAMLSFGAGNQQRVQEQYEKFGLLYTMQVFPDDERPDSLPERPLDDSALALLQAIPGVNLAYPLDRVSLDTRFSDTTVSARAQGLPRSALETQLFSHLTHGKLFSSDSAFEVVITDRFLRRFDSTANEALVGSTLIVTTRLATLDSALGLVFSDPDGSLRQRVAALRLDSLRSRAFRERAVREEAGAALQRFLDGLLKHRATVVETLTIVGVLETQHMTRRGQEELILPVGLVRQLTQGGVSDNPADLFATLSSGRIPWGGADGSSRDYQRVTLDLDPAQPYTPIKDSVKALGFDAFSYAEQFKEIREFFVYFDLALASIGLVALVTAALGIANTLFMATIERRREIGILQALGARRQDIRLLFLVESAVIGTLGALCGLVLGWGVSRIGSAIAQEIMERQGAAVIELFAVTWWLVIVALALGLFVSLVAGYIPATRAASVDPVEALRGD